MTKHELELWKKESLKQAYDRYETETWVRCAEYVLVPKELRP